LAAMSNEEAVQIVFKWSGCNSINGQSYDLKTRGLKVVNRNGSVYVERLWEVAKAEEMALYY